MADMETTVRAERRGRVGRIVMSRPKALNALDHGMILAIRRALDAWRDDPHVHAVTIEGEGGRAFCAGGDIGGFGGLDPKHLLTKLPRPFDMNRRPDYQTRHTYFPRLRKPVIGMLNGATAGLGMVYALCCDVRFAAETAVFTTAFARRGLSAEYGMAWMLPRVVGHANALDLLLSGRKFHAPEARALGLVNKVFPAETLADETYAYAREMAVWCSPRSMRVIKEQVYEVPFQTLHEAVMTANRDMLVSNLCADFKEGTASFKEKRAPNFPGEDE